MRSRERSMQLALIFLVTANLLGFVTALSPLFSCMDNFINYTSNRIYDANLNTLLSSLSSKVDNNGFYNASVGRSPDRAYATVLCRGDTQLNTCRTCVQDATIELAKSCPNQKQGIIYYELCTLRYSNLSLFGVLSNHPGFFYVTPQNATSPDQFIENRRKLLENLRDQAAAGGSLRKVAAGTTNTSSFLTVYALVQCFPDLSPDDCINCLNWALYIGVMPNFCYNKIGCSVLRPSCNFRYQIEPFYYETRLQEFFVMPRVPMAPGPMPPIALPPPGKKDDNATRTIIIVVVPIVVLLLVAVCVGVLLRKRIKKNPNQVLEIEGEISTIESLQYDFHKIRAATDDFSDANKLGQGGFGTVYKGKLSNGKEIAVKMLSTDSRQGDVEFKNEVSLLAKLQHRNLVRLLGFSLERNKKLIVYEFVQNGSLDKFIFDLNKRSNLNWEMRHKIIRGIARGLLYLHEDSRLRIIHRDLKAGNVLLDEEMNPKISDFGMARLFVPNETQGNTSRIAGTYGYMAPEYVMYGQFSVKSDVYSFGVLVLEIIRGQRKNYFQNGENVDDLLCCAWRHWRNGTSTNLIDPMLRTGSGTVPEMLRCIHIGLLCVQENVVDRPTMPSVVLMLSGLSLPLPIPSEPAFFVASGYDSDAALLQEYNSNELLESHKSSKSKLDESTTSSQNDTSITELCPR